METYRISEEEIKGMPVLATGYKIFYNDWTTKHGDYNYKDENGNVVGTIHKVDGDIVECQWGLHFSEEPHNCFSFYESLPWYKYARVEAYGNVIRSQDGRKSVAQIIKIIETYSFDEFINIIQEKLESDGVLNSRGVSDSHGVSWSRGVAHSRGVADSHGVAGSDGVLNSRGVLNSCGVLNSSGMAWSDGVLNSCGVAGSRGIQESNGVSFSNEISWSRSIFKSCGVLLSGGVSESCGVSESNGVSLSYGVLKSNGLHQGIFCYKKSGRLYLFNEHCTEERFNEVYEKLLSFRWDPKFHNAEELKGDLEWCETNIPAITSVDIETAWSLMPKEMLEYIQSLPEYNEEVFKKVTGQI